MEKMITLSTFYNEKDGSEKLLVLEVDKNDGNVVGVAFNGSPEDYGNGRTRREVN
jgi:hypothetical protein